MHLPLPLLLPLPLHLSLHLFLHLFLHLPLSLHLSLLRSLSLLFLPHREALRSLHGTFPRPSRQQGVGAGTSARPLVLIDRQCVAGVRAPHLLLRRRNPRPRHCRRRPWVLCPVGFCFEHGGGGLVSSEFGDEVGEQPHRQFALDHLSLKLCGERDAQDDVRVVRVLVREHEHIRKPRQEFLQPPHLLFQFHHQLGYFGGLVESLGEVVRGHEAGHGERVYAEGEDSGLGDDALHDEVAEQYVLPVFVHRDGHQVAAVLALCGALPLREH
mmetsp:Transcript_9233/g.20389  ORF Transcript_9233/g.20389 Transcript_9233/m.20389 type:complete len:270 (+) Transcript_9233:1-810(+)